MQQSERLALRHVRDSDASFLRGLLNEPFFIKTIGDRGVRTEDEARGYIAARIAASYAEHGYGLYLVEHRVSGAPLGLCGLVRRAFLDAPDIGFALRPAYWSQGYAFESARAILGYGRGIGINRVVALVLPRNEPSIRLLGKLGLGLERLIDLPDSPERCALYTPEGASVARRD